MKQWPDAKTASSLRTRGSKNLHAFGFQDFAQRGSHIKVRRVLESGQAQTLTVPNHDEIDRGTLRAIYRQACRFIPESDLHTQFFTD